MSERSDIERLAEALAIEIGEFTDWEFAPYTGEVKRWCERHLKACGLEVNREGTGEFLQGARIRKYGLNAKGYPEFTLVYPTRAGLDADHIAECFRRAASLTGEDG